MSTEVANAKSSKSRYEDTGGVERRYEKAKYAFDVRFLLNSPSPGERSDSVFQAHIG
jgi:hypothetical protein